MANCTNCGKPLKQGVAFCTSCGTPVKGGASTKTPTKSATAAKSAAPDATPDVAPDATMEAPARSIAPDATTDEVITTLGWIGTILVLVVPIVGLVLYFVWAFGTRGNLNRRNYCRAALIMMAISLVLGIISIVYIALNIESITEGITESIIERILGDYQYW